MLIIESRCEGSNPGQEVQSSEEIGCIHSTPWSSQVKLNWPNLLLATDTSMGSCLSICKVLLKVLNSSYLSVMSDILHLAPGKLPLQTSNAGSRVTNLPGISCQRFGGGSKFLHLGPCRCGNLIVHLPPKATQLTPLHGGNKALLKAYSLRDQSRGNMCRKRMFFFF